MPFVIVSRMKVGMFMYYCAGAQWGFLLNLPILIYLTSISTEQYFRQLSEFIIIIFYNFLMTKSVLFANHLNSREFKKI